MPPVAEAVRGWSGPGAADELVHVDTDPEWADTATFLEHYGPELHDQSAAWPLLVDAAVVDLPYVLVGSGARRGKLIVPGKAFAGLPNARVVEGLGTGA